MSKALGPESPEQYLESALALRRSARRLAWPSSPCPPRLERQEEADRLSAHAVAMAEHIDRLDVRGDVAWHRADVLRALGRGGEADEALRVGIEAFERKGFGPSAEMLRGLLARA